MIQLNYIKINLDIRDVVGFEGSKITDIIKKLYAIHNILFYI